MIYESKTRKYRICRNEKGKYLYQFEKKFSLADYVLLVFCFFAFTGWYTSSGRYDTKSEVETAIQQLILAENDNWEKEHEKITPLN